MNDEPLKSLFSIPDKVKSKECIQNQGDNLSHAYESPSNAKTDQGYTISATARPEDFLSVDEISWKCKEIEKDKPKQSVDSPEELEAWIEERKRKWPTERRLQEIAVERDAKRQIEQDMATRAKLKAKGKRAACRAFARSGSCSRGEFCKFSHIKSAVGLRKIEIYKNSLFVKVIYSF